jgi:hypothetical protein
MIAIPSALVSLLSFRVRSRASLELELIAQRHQVTVLRRLGDHTVWDRSRRAPRSMI